MMSLRCKQSGFNVWCILDTGDNRIGLQNSRQEDAIRRTKPLALQIEGGVLCANAETVTGEEGKPAVAVLEQSHSKSAMTFISKPIALDTAQK